MLCLISCLEIDHLGPCNSCTDGVYDTYHSVTCLLFRDVTMKSSMILNCAVKGQRSNVKVTVENILKCSVLLPYCLVITSATHFHVFSSNFNAERVNI